GGWARVRRVGALPDVQGELLAVGSDSLWVLDESGAVTAVGLGGVRRVEVYAYAPRTGGAAAWVLLGSLATISNGYYSVFTTPLWGLTGGIATNADRGAATPAADHGGGWEKIRRFARFPQGLPADLPRTLPPRTPGG
ncbi:MAG TPA: hypothetical protein VKA44_00115, partial [Gemmatimonadota bacterium]|nr:hypothetical protein [Gemmatimonadota bacterium]